MGIKLSEIRKEADDIIKTLFYMVLVCEDKSVWKKALSMIDDRIYHYHLSGEFIKERTWSTVKGKMSHKFGKKFIKSFNS